LRRGSPEVTKHTKNTWASETPVTDGERVYVFHASAGLFAVDFKGNLVWSRAVRMPEASGATQTQASAILNKDGAPKSVAASYFVGIGQASSPALHNGRIFISADHESRTWFFAAFDARTGNEVWRVVEPKPVEAYGWSTPFVWESGSRTESNTARQKHTRAHD